MTHQPRHPLHIAQDPASYVRPSARVATVATLLECDPGDIRRLIASGQLEAHGKGKRGVRVFLDSVQTYQERLTVIPKVRQAPARPRPRSAASTSAHRAAMAGLRAKGIV